MSETAKEQRERLSRLPACKTCGDKFREYPRIHDTAGSDEAHFYRPVAAKRRAR